MRRPLLVAVVVSVGVIASTQSAFAEPPNSGQNTVNVGPVSSGQAVGRGTAGFDPGGTQATSGSTTSAPAGPAAGTGSGPSDQGPT
jgi:hypothetical protein